MTWNFELVAGPYKGKTGGLAWDGKGMLFSVVQEERIMRYDPASGKAEVFRPYTGRTNGLAMAKDGTVYGAQEGGRRVVHYLKDGSTAPMPDLLDGHHHNQPTDLIVDSKGRVWFADAYNAQLPYGPPVYPMLEHASVLRLEQVNDGWRVVRVTHDTGGPRAVLLSKDEKTLFVADGDAERGNLQRLCSYPVRPEGDLGPVKVMIDFVVVERGIEGMCLDSEGNIIACAGWKKAGAGPNLYVISPSGTILETHPAPADMPMRVAFGDSGLGSLYLTTGDGQLFRSKDTGRKGLAR
ncbi:MAG TPA: SMP-30/gluconolactonase/LRE family protein [Burkholderiales bacterium]|jgi:gluconolactonase|nr:SMP-30/gluconolactonase/LRE family protein [Burkholderiales bacterium]